MPSGGSWTASQDTRIDVVLMADTITPVMSAKSYVNRTCNLNMSLNAALQILTYICSTALHLLWCSYSCHDVSSDRESVGGIWIQPCYHYCWSGRVVGVRYSIGGVGHLIHDDHPIWVRRRLPCECDGCEGILGGLKPSHWPKYYMMDRKLLFIKVV